MQLDLLTEFHLSPVAGHSGLQATLARLGACFYWPGMYSAAKNFISQCEIFLHPLATPLYGLFVIDCPSPFIS